MSCLQFYSAILENSGFSKYNWYVYVKFIWASSVYFLYLEKLQYCILYFSFTADICCNISLLSLVNNWLAVCVISSKHILNLEVLYNRMIEKLSQIYSGLKITLRNALAFIVFLLIKIIIETKKPTLRNVLKCSVISWSGTLCVTTSRTCHVIKRDVMLYTSGDVLKRDVMS